MRWPPPPFSPSSSNTSYTCGIHIRLSSPHAPPTTQTRSPGSSPVPIPFRAAEWHSFPPRTLSTAPAGSIRSETHSSQEEMGKHTKRTYSLEAHRLEHEFYSHLRRYKWRLQVSWHRSLLSSTFDSLRVSTLTKSTVLGHVQRAFQALRSRGRPCSTGNAVSSWEE